MQTTTKSASRLALLPVDERPQDGRPAIRRYRLGRIIDDLGLALAVASPPRAAQAPSQGVRAP